MMMYRQEDCREHGTRKAIDQGSEFGLDAHQILWVNEESRQMKYLYDKGIPCSKARNKFRTQVVMGNGAYWEMRIMQQKDFSDLDLGNQEAMEAFEQSLQF